MYGEITRANEARIPTPYIGYNIYDKSSLIILSAQKIPPNTMAMSNIAAINEPKKAFLTGRMTL
tara:strand:- start:266 stop:457 length:192 start_codon:yes stop_codon:yes gene_type:complete